jgi:hypothetical protein
LGSMPRTLALPSTSLTGSEPGERMKKMGFADSASMMAWLRISLNWSLESDSTKRSPYGRT